MLPGEAYTKGFLRTYAEHLGLNSQLYIDEYNARIARHDEDGPPLVPHPAVADRRSLGRGILVALAAILVVGATVAGLAAWRLGGSSTPPARNATPPSAVGSVAAAAPPPAATTAATPPPPKPVVHPVLTSISATHGRCWLLVRAGGANGKVLFEGILEQGQAKRFRFTTKLWLRMGRPSALDISVAGKPIGTTLPATPSNLVLTRAGSA